MLRAEQAPLQLWTYRLPQRQLRARDDVPHIDGQILLLNPVGDVVRITIEPSPDHQLCLQWQLPGISSEFRLRTTMPEELRIWLAGDWLVVCTREETGHVVRWLLLATGAECVRVQWPADAAPNVRPYDDEQFLLFDARGRLLSFNASSSQWQSLSLR